MYSLNLNTYSPSTMCSHLKGPGDTKASEIQILPSKPSSLVGRQRNCYSPMATEEDGAKRKALKRIPMAMEVTSQEERKKEKH
jgi:hypothetical protein